MTVPVPLRLRSAAALVPADTGAVADVGAGHGALAALLAMRGVPRVIATEAAVGPLRELRQNLDAWRLGSRVEVRFGDGLDVLVPGEVELAVIAGLGAHTVLGIAEAAPSRGVRRLILQCMQREHLVQPWLHARGWVEIAATRCVQRGRGYTTHLVEVGG